MLTEALEMLEPADHEERERAVRELVRVGEKALPELEKIRLSTSDDDLRWWIDVVIQQINLGK